MKKRKNSSLLLGALVGLVGVAGAASLLLARRPSTGSTGTAPGPLATAGTLAVGVVSSIPRPALYDTGAVDQTYNRPGWEYARLGGT